MKIFQSKVQALLKSLGFTKSNVTIEQYDKNPILKLTIPLKDNGKRDLAYRKRLNDLGHKLSDLGLLWADESPSMNHLCKKCKNGEPWMLFGDETIELKPNPANVSHKIITNLAQALIVNNEDELATDLIKLWPSLENLEKLSNGGGFHYSTLKLNDFDIVLSNEAQEQAEFTLNDWTAAIYEDFDSNTDPLVIVSSEEE